MYLVGDLSDRDYFKGCGLKVKPTITKEDLAKTKGNESFQVIDLANLSYYDPAQNQWIPLDKG